MLFPHSEHWMHSSFHFWRCMQNAVVNALVTSRLDYGNALLYGITTKLTDKLQRVHSTAARLITRTKKTDHITPVLSPRFLCRPTTFFLFARAVGRSKKKKRSALKQSSPDNRSWWGVLDTNYVIKCVSDLLQVGSFLRFPPSVNLTTPI
jgi:hypothetical protein